MEASGKLHVRSAEVRDKILRMDFDRAHGDQKFFQFDGLKGVKAGETG
jgi:hypothetical protein